MVLQFVQVVVQVWIEFGNLEAGFARDSSAWRRVEGREPGLPSLVVDGRGVEVGPVNVFLRDLTCVLRRAAATRMTCCGGSDLLTAPVLLVIR